MDSPDHHLALGIFLNLSSLKTEIFNRVVIFKDKGSLRRDLVLLLSIPNIADFHLLHLPSTNPQDNKTTDTSSNSKTLKVTKGGKVKGEDLTSKEISKVLLPQLSDINSSIKEGQDMISTSHNLKEIKAIREVFKEIRSQANIEGKTIKKRIGIKKGRISIKATMRIDMIQGKIISPIPIEGADSSKIGGNLNSISNTSNSINLNSKGDHLDLNKIGKFMGISLNLILEISNRQVKEEELREVGTRVKVEVEVEEDPTSTQGSRKDNKNLKFQRNQFLWKRRRKKKKKVNQ